MLSVENTFAVIIDVQGNLANIQYERESLFDNLQKLIRGLRVLGVPIILTEENPEGLGPTIPQLTNLLTGVKPIPRVFFGACYENEFIREVEKLNRKQVLIGGIEAQACVYQTAMGLLGLGYEVQIVADCVSSRTVRNRDIAFKRLQSEGAKLTSVEMALFELVKRCDSARFKEILKVVK